MIWYRVQIGAYAIKKSAEKVSVDLIEKGFKTSITKEGMLYKVRIGSFQDKKKAEKLLARVRNYKKYEKSKILEWNDGKDIPIVNVGELVPDISDAIDDGKHSDYRPKINFVAIWHTETHESMYGDAQVFIEYAENGTDILHAVLVDTGMDGCDTIKKLKKLGVKKLDAIVISHAHGDHYGYLSEILRQFKVLHLYLPGIEGLKKYQPSFAKAIQRQEAKAKKLGIPVRYLSTGAEFTVGHIHCECLYQVPADKLKNRDNHLFVNDQSIATMFTLDGVGRVLLTGDLSNPGNEVVMKVFKVNFVPFWADIAKCGWHGDGGAMLETWAKFVGAICWYWNYHHAMKKGGRQNTLKKLLAAGVKEDHVYRNYEDGDITFSYCDGWWTVTKSKNWNYSYKFKSRFVA